MIRGVLVQGTACMDSQLATRRLNPSSAEKCREGVLNVIRRKWRVLPQRNVQGDWGAPIFSHLDMYTLSS